MACKKKYFFVNSNICFPEDKINFDKFIFDIAGNTGNSYISYSIIKILYGKFQKVDDIKNLWFYQSSQRDIDKINNEYSKVILVLQDNLRLFDSYYKHEIYHGLADFFKKIKIPIVVFSLGSNSFDGNYKKLHEGVSKSLVNLLKILADKTVSFGVRGQFTLEILHNLKIQNAEAIGCPSYFETGPNRLLKKPPLNSDFKILSGGYFKNQHTKDVHYVLQDEKLFIKAIAFSNERILPKDLSNLNLDTPLLEAYAENRMSVFSDIDEWKDFAKNFNFYIGTRVHGAIVAINSGLPAIITNQDSRAREMCDLFGISRFEFDQQVLPKEIYESIDVDIINSRYNLLYDNFVKWLGKNDLSPAIPDKSGENSLKEKLCQNNFVGYEKISSLKSELFILSQKNTSNLAKRLVLQKMARLVSRAISAFIFGKKRRKTVRNLIFRKLAKFDR